MGSDAQSQDRGTNTSEGQQEWRRVRKRQRETIELVRTCDGKRQRTHSLVSEESDEDGYYEKIEDDRKQDGKSLGRIPTRHEN